MSIPVRPSLRRIRGVVALVLVVSAGSVLAEKAGGSFPTNEDLRHTRGMNHPRLSPDGHSVLVEVSDATADGGKGHLWLVDIAKNTSRQITYTLAGGKGGESTGEWMPDGSGVLFTAHRGEHTQLFRLPLSGGEAQPFDLKVAPAVDESTAADAIPPRDAKAPAEKKTPDAIPVDVSGYAVSPDGQTIAILARDPETAGEKKQKDEKADAVWVNHEQHRTRVYLFHPAMPGADGKVPAIPLTVVPVDGDAQDVIWNRKGDKFVVLAEAPNEANDLAPAGSAWLVLASEPAHPQQWKHVPATVASGEWSDDDAHFFFLAQAKADVPPGYADAYVLNVADGSVANLSDGFTGSIGRGDLIAEEGGAMLTAIEQGTRIGYGRIQAAKTGVEPVAIPEGAVVVDLGTNRNRTGWVYLRSSSVEPATLCYSETLEKAAKTLAMPEMMPGKWTAVESKLVSWKSDGHTIEGLLSLPPGASAGKKVPLLVDVHGGPLGAWSDSYSAYNAFLLGHGWAILRPNPRGSSGKGAAFAAANKNDLGGGDYRDIMAGVDAVIRDYPVNPDKMALMGYSYGGEMAAFVEGKTDRFKAIISAAPVIDQFSEYGTEKGSWYDQWYYGKPWEHMEDAWRQSPLSGVARAKTPFLLLQGESDVTDPLGQSQEMYRALRQAGVKVEMVQYPREDHGPLARGMMGGPIAEPWHGFDARQRVVRFLEQAFGEATK